MTRYEIEVTRDGRWWMVNVPAIGELTQARRFSEARTMARELIALCTCEHVDQISLEIASITVPGLGDINSSVINLHNIRERADQLTKQTRDLTAGIARDFTGAGISVRDTAELLGVCYQRISQLTSRKHADDEPAADQNTEGGR